MHDVIYIYIHILNAYVHAEAVLHKPCRRTSCDDGSPVRGRSVLLNHVQRCRAISKGAVLHPMWSISCCLSVGSGAQKMIIQWSVHVLQRSSTQKTNLHHQALCRGLRMSKHTVECDPASNLTTYITFCIYIERGTWRNHWVSHMILACIKHVYGWCVVIQDRIVPLRYRCVTSISSILPCSHTNGCGTSASPLRLRIPEF